MGEYNAKILNDRSAGTYGYHNALNSYELTNQLAPWSVDKKNQLDVTFCIFLFLFL